MPEIPFQVTEDFRQRVIGAFEEEGVAWLNRLQAIVEECAERWSLRLELPFPLSYNYVAPATLPDGTPVVLKVGCPNPEIRTEFESLQLFDSEVISRLIDHDVDRCALLMERVQPGTPLTELAMEDDERATAIAIDIMPRLWRPVPASHSFPSVAGWARGLERHRNRFDGSSGPLPARLFEEAEECFDWLLSTTTNPQLLHGDLHHDNILTSSRAGWLVIDPKGITGDPGYDLGAFLYNPIPGLLEMPQPGSVIARRVDQLAEGLGMERARVRGWGIAQAVLSACWSIDDDQDWRYTITCAEYLSQLKA